MGSLTTASEKADMARLARLCGITSRFWDNQGRRHQTRDATRRALLRAMGVEWESPAQIREEIQKREELQNRLLPPVATVWLTTAPHLPLAVRLPAPEVPSGLHIAGELVAEDGSRLPVTGPLTWPGRPRWHETPHGWRGLAVYRLPPEVMPGHYEVHLELTGAGGREIAKSRLIVAPPGAFLPECLAGGARLYGLNLPLYALRSRHNWGIGDFTDLADAMDWARELGAAFVGINPLHAALPGPLSDPSPYSPATRLFTNFLYLDLRAVPEMAHCPEARDYLGGTAGRTLLRRLRAAAILPYPEVYAVKRDILQRLYEVFRQEHGGEIPKSARGREFQEFCRRRDHYLHDFALYVALAEFHGTSDWRRWPEAYRSRQAPAVAEFARQQPEAVAFWEYVQWLAAQQLARVHKRAQAAGLPFSLYQDLALGAAPGGFETWAFPHLFARGAATGAPPDAFNPKGQNWGLPPLIPERLKESGYDLFIRTLRANLPPGGMLRLDHVMGLFRLFWIPDTPEVPGAYVRYPAADLLAILSLESHRARTLIVGEDLGTVAPAIRRELGRRRIFSYKVFIFEREADGRFRPPAAYPPQSLAATTTHDLPTLAGYWQGEDIVLKTRFHLYPQAQMAAADTQARERDRVLLLEALAAEGLIPAEELPRLAASPGLPPEVRWAVLEYLARSRAALLEVRLEEVFGLLAQQNLPGTLDEHPNWRQKFPLNLEEMRKAPEAVELAARLRPHRGWPPPSPPRDPEPDNGQEPGHGPQK
ncbi:MAG: 4-alpha-glucanotransferase [Desulfobaccales bacterium]